MFFAHDAARFFCVRISEMWHNNLSVSRRGHAALSWQKMQSINYTHIYIAPIILSRVVRKWHRSFMFAKTDSVTHTPIINHFSRCSNLGSRSFFWTTLLNVNVNVLYEQGINQTIEQQT